METKVLTIRHEALWENGQLGEDKTLQEKIDQALNSLVKGWVVKSAKTHTCACTLSSAQVIIVSVTTIVLCRE